MVEIKKLEKIRDYSIEKSNIKLIQPILDSKEKEQVVDNYQPKQIVLKKIKLASKTITNASSDKGIGINKEKENKNDVIPDVTAYSNKNNSLEGEELRYKENAQNYVKAIEDSQNEFIQENLLFQIEKKKLEVISNNLNKSELSNDSNLIDSSSSDIDDLLDNLNKQTNNMDEDKPFLEMITFLEDKPKINKITIKNLDVSNLYSKIDEIEKKGEKTKVIQTEYINQNKINNNSENSINNKKEKKIDIIPLIEKIDIPEIMTLEDDTTIVDALKDKYISAEKKSKPEKPKEPNFVNSDKKLKPNPDLENQIKNIKIKADVLKVSTPLDYRTPKSMTKEISEKDKFNYILPKDYLNNQNVVPQEITIDNNTKKVNLIYDSEIRSKKIEFTEINEKYNIDEFTFVNIKYNNKELQYNIIQPELTKIQEEAYYEVKKIFLDSIDANYYSFKGDKQGIQNYIKKIFDLTVDKISFDITGLEKKLYFNFIKQEFSGLGFLASVLDDKNIIEVNCAGAELPITVYHIKYGLIPTNLKFEKISQLNLFVLSITKVMGIRVNSAHPIISGYLPNGYKVEGLYSVGDTSNKGSSFLIKKYLEEPLTPNSLINLGIGTTDLFSYIWCALDQEYQIIITGGDAILLINSIAQFYPNKKIVSVQSYDYFKFPQKNWIKRIINDESVVNKKTLLSQSLSERPDYLIVDDFSRDLFDLKWYDINLTFVNTDILPEYLDKIKSIGINAIVIHLDRIKSKDFEQTQISKITEIEKGKEQLIIDYNKDENVFHINLIPSNINVVNFYRKQKLLRWILDADISDYLDFNNIINDYNLDNKKLFNKLNIIEKE